MGIPSCECRMDSSLADLNSNAFPLEVPVFSASAPLSSISG